MADGFLSNLAGRITEAHDRYKELQDQAAAYANSHRGEGSCAKRGGDFAAAVDLAIPFAKLSEEIYAHDYGTRMEASGAVEKTFPQADGDVIALRDPNHDFYAEVHPTGDAVTVVFRGTRRNASTDLVADASQFMGLPSDYYSWASSALHSAMAKYPGRRVVATGHSLGGGLAMYAALINGTSAVIFNPAGISAATLEGIPANSRTQGASRIMAFMARHQGAFDPVSALSLASRSSILGRIFVVPVTSMTAISPVARHSISLLRATLEEIASGLHSGRARSADFCDADLGFSS